MPRSGISELLEIVFHYILFSKKIYPEKLFEKRIKCNLPIWVRFFFPLIAYACLPLLFTFALSLHCVLA